MCPGAESGYSNIYAVVAMEILHTKKLYLNKTIADKNGPGKFSAEKLLFA
jgi:hypothetical protein